MKAKDTIVYVFDPMCGWCYGFSNIIKQTAAEYKDDFEFQIISGGMVVGEREGPIGDFADYILGAYKRVEEYSGIKFGEPYLAQLKTKDLYSSSVVPSIALEAFKFYHPKEAIAFASSMQQAYFFRGEDLRKDEVYIELIKPYGIPEKEFLKKLHSEAYKQKALEGFQASSNFGVSGFPAVLALHKGQYYSLAKGFTDKESLCAMLEQLKSLK